MFSEHSPYGIFILSKHVLTSLQTCAVFPLHGIDPSIWLLNFWMDPWRMVPPLESPVAIATLCVTAMTSSSVGPRWPPVTQKVRKNNNKDDNGIHAYDGINRGDVNFNASFLSATITSPGLVHLGQAGTKKIRGGTRFHVIEMKKGRVESSWASTTS